MFPGAVTKIFDAFEAVNVPIRLVGGCVRDRLKRKEPKDWDFATPATPDEICKILTDAGYEWIDPGRDHGTISAIVSNVMYEITTLRIDAETDGRHAKVVFTDDWQADAARRDFTVNAMSMERDGTLHDYFEGEYHSDMDRLVFVGDPVQRIEEDYLRILRFFRFQTRGYAPIDKDIYRIIANRIQKLCRTVSRERIYHELNQMFNAPRHILRPIMANLWQVGFFQEYHLEIDWNIFANPRESVWNSLTFRYVDDMRDCFMVPKEVMDYYEKSAIMRRYSGTIYDQLKLELEFKIPRETLARYYGVTNLPELKVDANELMRLGFKDKSLGQEIYRIKSNIISTYKYE